MLKKKVNGAWSALDNVKKKTNGTWSDCTSVKKISNGYWVNVWRVKKMSVYSSNLRNNLSNDNWYYISYNPAYDVHSQFGRENFYITSLGSDVITSDSSQGIALYMYASLAAGESMYIDQYCFSRVSDAFSQSVYAYAMLFDYTVNSTTNPKKALAKASLTKERQVITLTSPTDTAYLYFYLGFTSDTRHTEVPSIVLNVFGIRSDSGRYVFE